jgi:hypothetical protein
MNSTEQRTHKKATSDLDARLTHVETVCAGLADSLVEVTDTCATDLAAVDAHAVSMVNEAHGQLGRRLDLVTAWMVEAQTRTVWQRLRWLLTGE